MKAIRFRRALVRLCILVAMTAGLVGVDASFGQPKTVEKAPGKPAVAPGGPKEAVGVVTQPRAPAARPVSRTAIPAQKVGVADCPAGSHNPSRATLSLMNNSDVHSHCDAVGTPGG